MVLSEDRAYWSVGCVLVLSVRPYVNEASNMLRARDDEGQGILKPMLVGFAQRFPIWASPELAMLSRRCRFLVHEAVIGNILLVLGPFLGSNVGVAFVLLERRSCWRALTVSDPPRSIDLTSRG